MAAIVEGADIAGMDAVIDRIAELPIVTDTQIYVIRDIGADTGKAVLSAVLLRDGGRTLMPRVGMDYLGSRSQVSGAGLPAKS